MCAGYNYKECSRIEAMYKYLNLLKYAQEVSTGTSEKCFEVSEKIHSDENNFAVSSEIHELIRKRNASRNQLLTGVADGPRRSRSKICRMSDQVVSTSSEQDGIKKDYGMDVNSTNPNLLERICLTNMNHELTRIEESQSHNHGKQALDILGNKMTFPHWQYTASNVNFNENISSSNKYSDPRSFEEKTTFSIGNNHSVPGPSQNYEKISQTNSRLEHFKYGSRLKPQKAIESEKESLICWGCNKEVSTQFKEIEGLNQYKYCMCPYWCTFCGVGYSVEGSHEIEHTCNVCQKTFLCKTQLEIHYFSHENHHETYCRLCQKELVKHIKGKDINYNCCICTYKHFRKSCFKRHLYSHSDLKIFKCKQCGKPYCYYESLLHHFENHK